MDKWSRNERLYRHLVEMGLFCSPIFTDNTGDRIEAIQVSVDLPAVPTTSVVAPVKRPQIGESITSASGDGSNVIHFPTIF